jgi:hypothetical protein
MTRLAILLGLALGRVRNGFARVGQFLWPSHVPAGGIAFSGVWLGTRLRRSNNVRLVAHWILLIFFWGLFYNMVGCTPQPRETRSALDYQSASIEMNDRLPTEDETSSFIASRTHQQWWEEWRDWARLPMWVIWLIFFIVGILYIPIALREETLYKILYWVRRRRYRRRIHTQQSVNVSPSTPSAVVAATSQETVWSLRKFFKGLWEDAPREIIWEVLERIIMSFLRGRMPGLPA